MPAVGQVVSRADGGDLSAHPNEKEMTMTTAATLIPASLVPRLLTIKPLFWTCAALAQMPRLPFHWKMHRDINKIVGSNLETARGLLKFNYNMFRITHTHLVVQIRRYGMSDPEQLVDDLMVSVFSRQMFKVQTLLAFTNVEPLGTTEKIDQIIKIILREYYVD